MSGHVASHNNCLPLFHGITVMLSKRFLQFSQYRPKHSSRDGMCAEDKVCEKINVNDGSVAIFGKRQP